MSTSATASYTGYYLGPFMSPLTDLLSHLSSEIGEGQPPPPTSLLGKYQTANNESWQKASDLVLQGSLPAQGNKFAGPGSQAFLQSVQRHLLATDQTLGLLSQVETSISAYTTTVIDHCNTEDGNLSALESQLRNYCHQRSDVEAALLSLLPQNSVSGLIHEIIKGATLASVTQDGTASDLLASLDTVHYRTLHTLTQDSQHSENTSNSPQHIPADKEKDVTAAFDLLSQELQTILQRWASLIQQDTATFLQELTHLGVPERLNLDTSLSALERTPFNLSLAGPHQRGLTNQPLTPNGIYGLVENVPYGLPLGDPGTPLFPPSANSLNDPLIAGDPTNPFGIATGSNSGVNQNDPLIAGDSTNPLVVVIGHIAGDNPPGDNQQNSDNKWEWSTITATVSDDGTVVIGDAAGGGKVPGFIFPEPFKVRGSMRYTIHIPVAWDSSHNKIPYLPPNTGPYPPPVIGNIWHDVIIFGGNLPRLAGATWSLSASSSVEVYSGNGTLLQTVTGTPAGTISPVEDPEYAWQDVSQIQTTVPYQPYSWGFVGPQSSKTLFRLKHIMWVVASAGYQGGNSLPVPFHDVNAQGI